MGKRVFLAVSMTGAVGIALLWWLNFQSPSAPVTALPSPSIQPRSPTPTTQTSQPERQVSGAQYEPTDPRWAEVNAKDKVDRAWEWKRSINFYGRVLDENEQPVLGANIYAQWSDLSANGASVEETLSDQQGAFSITGKTGRGITIRVSKEGYYTPKRQRSSFDYAAFWEVNYHQADPNKPVLFHLRNKNVTEALTVGEIRPTLPADGTPMRFDVLRGGDGSAGGQVEIAAMTNTEKYPPRIFDWQASITIPDGGLLEYDAEFPFEAPKNGYVPRVEFNMPATTSNWKRVIEKSYFIQFGSPARYGRIQVRFNGASQKCSLSYAVNPSGSRNLEAELPQAASP
jgi:hypothetical protein